MDTEQDIDSKEIESAVDDTAPEQTTRPIMWWLKFLKAAKKAAKKHWRDGRDAWNEYLCTERQVESASQLRYVQEKKYRIFWSSVRSIQPAFYARTPQVVANRLFDIDDPVARVGCTLIERLGTQLLKGGEFDATMCAIRDDFILTEKATARVYFEADVRQEKVGYEEAQGEGMDDMPQEPMLEDVLKSIKVCTLPINFDDIVHTPFARHWDEIQEIAWRVPMTKAAFKARFGASHPALQSVSFGDSLADLERDSDLSGEVEENVDQSAKAADAVTWVWECWCKLTKKVYWVSETYNDGFLDVKPDPYELVGFFPVAPFIIGTKPDKTLYPVPMFVPLRPLIAQLHNLINKIFQLISAVRRRAIADGSCDDLIAAINNLDDNEVIAVQNFAQIVEKGGVANLIQYLPVQELSNAIVELQGLTAVFKNEFFEFSGVPDLLRGSSDPIETAAAQQQKGNFLSLRFSWPQKQIQVIARDLIEMMIDLALKKFPDDYLAQICGVQHLTPEEQQLVPQAFQLLRDDKSRVVRIDIETDSTSYLNELEQRQNKNLVAQTVVNGLKEIASISQTAPAFTGTALKVLLFSLRSMNMGKSFEGEVTAAVGAMEQQMQQQQQAAAQQPPPPDYEQMKLQLQQQKLAVEQQKAQAEIQQQSMELQLKQQADMQDAALKQAQLQLEQRIVQFTEFIEQQRLQLEQYKAQLGLQEQFMEEQRLAQDTQLRMLEQAQPKPDKGPETVIINAPQSSTPVAPAAPVLPTFTPTGL